MTLDKLTSSPDRPQASPRGKRRLPALTLPVGLLLAFVLLFGLLFGGRLLPAAEVRVAPVITLRTSSSGSPASSPGQEAGSEAAREAPASETATAANRGSLLFQSSGWVEPDPYITMVPALVNGVVREVHVLEGQSVKKDDLLAKLIDDDAVLDVQEATRTIRTLDATQVAHCAQLPVLNSEMHAVQQRIAAARSLLAEYTDAANRLASVPKGAVPALDVEKARLKVEGQQAVIDELNAELAGVLAKINKVDLERLAVDARIRAAQTVLARKELALARTEIKAPMDGIVLHLHAAPGKKRMLEADDPKSAAIVELYDPKKLQARIDVPLTEAAALKVGQPVLLSTDLLPDVKFEAEVTRIVGEADLQRNTLQAKVRILDPDPRLRPEMLVRAEFYPGSTGTAAKSPAGRDGRLSLFVPIDALFDRSPDSARVWLADGDRAELRDLKVGLEVRDGHLIVHDGLRSGDKVILKPHTRLKPGKRIKITN